MFQFYYEDIFPKEKLLLTLYLSQWIFVFLLDWKWDTLQQNQLEQLALSRPCVTKLYCGSW